MTAPLAIVGNLNVDLWVMPVSRMPAKDEEVVVDSARLELAGTAGYMAHACRVVGIEPRIVSTIGDDAFGRATLDGMAAIGAPDAGVEVVPGEETSLGIVFIAPDGSRGLLSTLGAHRLMDVAVAERHDASVVPCAEVMLCGTYLLPRFGPAEVVGYASALRARGQLVAFDPSWDPAGWPPATREATYALLGRVDVFLPNEEELRHLTGAGSLAAAIDEVAARSGEVVVKRGADGAVWASGGERVSVPAFPVTAVNTIGAGDIFDIGYLWARRQGWEPARRLRFAQALAGVVIAQPGARVYPALESVLALAGEADDAEPAG